MKGFLVTRLGVAAVVRYLVRAKLHNRAQPSKLNEPAAGADDAREGGAQNTLILPLNSLI